jgi:hypothetical protein
MFFAEFVAERVFLSIILRIALIPYASHEILDDTIFANPETVDVSGENSAL